MEVLRRKVNANEDGSFSVEAGETYEMTWFPDSPDESTCERVIYLAPFVASERRT